MYFPVTVVKTKVKSIVDGFLFSWLHVQFGRFIFWNRTVYITASLETSLAAHQCTSPRLSVKRVLVERVKGIKLGLIPSLHSQTHSLSHGFLQLKYQIKESNVTLWYEKLQNGHINKTGKYVLFIHKFNDIFNFQDNFKYLTWFKIKHSLKRNILSVKFSFWRYFQLFDVNISLDIGWWLMNMLL